MSDEAPESTKYLRKALGWHRELADIDLDRIEITTKVDSKRRAVSTLTRPVVHFTEQHMVDKAFADAFGELPGFADSYAITMGRTFEVEWDGVRAPI